MENNNFFNNIPTSAIVICFILFWPLGIVLLIMKYSNKNTLQFQAYKNLNVAQNNIMNTTNLNTLKNKRTSARIGSIIAFVFGALFFVVACDYLFFNGSHINENTNISMTNTYSSSYTNTVYNQTTQTKSIEFSTAAVGGVIAAFCFFIGVRKWIKSVSIGNKIQKIEIYQNLILIREIYDVDEIARYLNTSKIRVLDNVSDMIREGYLLGIRVKQNEIEKIPDYVDPNRVFNIKCPSCGANNKYTKGIENKCEYCGTVLNLNNLK